MPEIDLLDILLRLAVAAGLTGAIGIERELRERGAGLRTHMLVGVGAALFTIVSAYGWGDFIVGRSEGTMIDPTRIAAQIVTGVGFLGAGAIIRQGITVRGLTTAAGLWVVAAIGMAAGAGFFSVALIGTGVVLVALGPLRVVEGASLHRLRREGRMLEVDLRPEQGVAPVLDSLERRGARVVKAQLEEGDDRRILQIELDVESEALGREAVDELSTLQGISAVRWSG